MVLALLLTGGFPLQDIAHWLKEHSHCFQIVVSYLFLLLKNIFYKFPVDDTKLIYFFEGHRNNQLADDLCGKGIILVLHQVVQHWSISFDSAKL